MAAENKKEGNPITLQVGEKPPLAQHDSSVLDLAFAMDVTGSMGSYIHAAQKSIRQIVEEIVSAEKSDIRLALVEYRDHPPQDSSFVTRTHGFTDSVKTMKTWLDACTADGGGDEPEAVADALHDVFKLDWREEATKICVLISDAPPHGLMGGHDGFPDGCPAGNDPVVTINKMAEKNITVYSVGCEPSVNHCRDFFMALAHITGGQYVPLGNAKMLAKVIVGGAQEEITLQRLMDEVHEEVMTEMQNKGTDELDEDLLAFNVHEKLKSRGAKTKALFRNNEQLEAASDFAQAMTTKGGTMSAWKDEWKAAGKASEPIQSFAFGGGAPMMMRRGEAADEDMLPMDMLSMPMGGAPPPMACSAPMMSRAAPMAAPMGFSAMPESGLMAECDDVQESEPSESYQVVDMDLNLEQAKRMVKKSLAKNKATFKK